MSPCPETLARDVLQRLPALAALLEAAGARLLTDHVRMLGTSLPSPVQSRHDLPACLERTPVVLTANHHGLDTLAQSWQSTLAFALPGLLDTSAPGPSPVPVLATGLPSLNNVTFPAGLLCSDFSPHAGETRTIKIPLAPARLRQTMAAAAPPVTREDLQRSCRAVREDVRLLPAQRQAALDFLEDLRSDIGVRPDNRFADQAARWNRLLWSRLFVDGLAPPLEFLELETVTARLLQGDLLQPSSLMWGLLWDEAIRTRLLAALDGCPGCWTMHRLEQCCGLDRPGHDDLAGAGTCFFWAADHKGRQTPLRLERTASGWRLSGSSRSGYACTWPWEPAAVLEGLASRRLLPSLFTSYAALALARGVVCVGGVYQSAYLARMAAGTARALGQTGHPGLAAKVAAIPGDWFLAGVHLLLVRAGTCLSPAHAVDVLAAGGGEDAGPLGPGDLRAMGRLTLGEAILAGLAQTYGEVAPGAERPVGWRDALCAHAVSTWAPGLVVRAMPSGGLAVSSCPCS
ncbi:MAG: hypothetical protein LDL27_05280 [Desulfovibrio sp.]|nr:hypothetical protein [Desulfovibrio sp.]